MMMSVLSRAKVLAIAALWLSGCSGGLPRADQGASAAALGRPSTAAITYVYIQDYSFQPSTIKVKAGTAIVFANRDSVQHTATADNGSFGSPKLSRGHLWKHTFGTKGTYKYHCRIHPYMHGIVVVTK
jgi:plastocyanin